MSGFQKVSGISFCWSNRLICLVAENRRCWGEVGFLYHSHWFFFSAYVAPDILFAEDQIILLDESLIIGTQLGEVVMDSKKRIAGPALSTELRWEGEENAELDIPKEILDHLTRPDLTFFINRDRDRDFFDDETE